MTKQEILDRFSDIDFVYNDSSKHETLSRMLDDLLKEQQEQIDTQKENFAHLAAKLATQPEIVRCKDCLYWQDNNGGYPHPDCRWGHDETPDEDDYCSFGERRGTDA
jgi:hypothetical protein